MGRRDGSQVVRITTLGDRPPRPPRRHISVGGALAAGLAVLVLYSLISLIFHVVAAAALWLPGVLAAGYVTTFAGRRGLVGAPRLVLGIVVLVAVHVGLLAAVHAL